MKKIFCFINYTTAVGVEVVSISEDGEHLENHLSSSVGWAKYDIGINSDRKHDKYKEACPEGYELVWLERVEFESNGEFLKALEIANKKTPK